MKAGMGSGAQVHHLPYHREAQVPGLAWPGGSGRDDTYLTYIVVTTRLCGSLPETETVDCKVPMDGHGREPEARGSHPDRALGEEHPVHGWMDGWVGGWVDGWMGRWMAIAPRRYCPVFISPK